MNAPFRELQEENRKLNQAVADAYQLLIQGDNAIARDILRVRLGISIAEQTKVLKERKK
jgi:hypothetical protein